jgi:GNAT superfamily N-acetyltransferase
LTDHFSIQIFDKNNHNRKDFSCGIESMDNWLKTSVSSQIKHNRIRLWCAVNDNDEFVGFYALSAHQVAFDDAQGLAYQEERYPIPAIYLKAIGVKKTYQEQGIGTELLVHAILRCITVSEQIGVAAIILNVEKDDNYKKRVVFYQKYGFDFFRNKDNRMFLSVNDAKSLTTN